MDKLEVILTQEKTEEEVTMIDGKMVQEEFECVNFYVNGKSLIKMVGEKLFERGKGSQGPRYGYMGLNPQDNLLPYDDVMINLDKKGTALREENGKILFARCALCGELCCGGLALHIDIEDKSVIWDQIGHWSDTRPEGVVGPFVFDRKEYEQALQIEYVEYQTGRAYEQGIYVEKDMQKAEQYFKRSAEKGYKPSAKKLG